MIEEGSTVIVESPHSSYYGSKGVVVRVYQLDPAGEWLARVQFTNGSTANLFLWKLRVVRKKSRVVNLIFLEPKP